MINDPSKGGAPADTPVTPRKTTEELYKQYEATRPKAFREGDVVARNRGAADRPKPYGERPKV